MATMVDWEIAYYVNQDWSPNAGNKAIELTDYNYVPMNPYDIMFANQFAGIPESDVQTRLSTGHLGQSIISLSTQLYGADSEAMIQKAATVNGTLRSVAEYYDPKGCFLRFGLIKSGVVTYFYRWCVPAGSQMPIQQSTQLEATQRATILNFATTDPGMYAVQETENFTVASGSNSIIFNPATAGSRVFSNRMYIRIDRKSVDLPSVTVSGDLFEYTITGAASLGAGEYWIVDGMWGRVRRMSGINIIEEFTGQFPKVNNSADEIEVDVGGTRDCDVYITYMPRLF